MTKKQLVVLAVTILAVASFFFYLYGDDFRKPHIQIFHTIRPKASALVRRAQDAAEEDDVNVITFALHTDFKLKSVKVLSKAELDTNKFAHPLWELTTDSNSVPTRTFAYGSKIRGMHPAVKGAKADPLTPNVTYRLLVASDTMTGEHDFKITEDSHLAH